MRLRRLYLSLFLFPTFLGLSQRKDTTYFDNGKIERIWKENYSDSIYISNRGLVENAWYVEDFNEKGKQIYFYLEDTLSRKVIAQKAFDQSGNILRYDMALDQKNNSGYERFYSPKGKLIWENQLSNAGYEGKVKLNYELDLFDLDYSYYLSEIDQKPFFKTDNEYEMPYYTVDYVNGLKEGIYKSARDTKGEFKANKKEGAWCEVNWVNGSDYRGWKFYYGEYKNGLKNGVWVELSDIKDTLLFETYVNDTLNGEVRNYKEGVYQQSIYYKDGRENQPANYLVNSDYEKGRYVNHKREGLWKFFYSNGQEVHLNFKEGKLQSPYVRIRRKENNSDEMDTMEIASLEIGATYSYGGRFDGIHDARKLKRDGPTYIRFSSEQEYDTLWFERNQLVKYLIYYQKVHEFSPQSVTRHKLDLERSSPYRYFGSHFGIEKEEGNLTIGQDSSKIIKGRLKDDKRTGLWETYIDGELYKKGNYLKGKKFGPWISYKDGFVEDSTIYNENQKIIESWNFNKGKPISAFKYEYDQKGRRIKTLYFNQSLGKFLPSLENQYSDEGELIGLKIWDEKGESFQEFICDDSEIENNTRIEEQAHIVLPFRENSFFSGVSFSQNGKYAYVFYNEGNSGINYLIDIDNHQVIKEFAHITEDGDYTFKISNTGRYLMALKYEREVHLIDLLQPKKKVALDYFSEFWGAIDHLFSFSEKDSVIYAANHNTIFQYSTTTGKLLKSDKLPGFKARVERIYCPNDSLLIVWSDDGFVRFYSKKDLSLLKEKDFSRYEISNVFENEYFLDLKIEDNYSRFYFTFINAITGDSIFIDPNSIIKKWVKGETSFLSYSLDTKMNKAYLWFDKGEKSLRKKYGGGQAALIVWDFKLNEPSFVSNHYPFSIENHHFSQVTPSGNLFFLGTPELNEKLGDDDNEKWYSHISEYSPKERLISKPLYENKLLASPDLLASNQNILVESEEYMDDYSNRIHYEFDLGKGLINFAELSSKGVNWGKEDEVYMQYQSEFDSLDMYFSNKGYYDTDPVPSEVEKLIRCQVIADLGIDDSHEDIYVSDFKDNKVILVNGLNKCIDHFNYNKIRKIERKVSLFLDGNGEFIFTTPDRYYFASQNARDFIHFEKDLKTYPFEQFDLKYNRPDIILDRLGYADSSLIQAYHHAYKKRLKKMGFTEEMLKDDFHIPELKIENFEEMPTITGENQIELNLKMKDDLYKLDRINIWINDVAVYGSNGISLRNKNVKEYAQNMKLDLAKGKNKIQVSVLNQAGAESYKETIEIECTKGKAKPDLFLITIGVSEFQQEDYNLTYAGKDAQDIAQLFEKNKVFEQVYSKVLTNQEVTKENIQKLKTFLKSADINDEVMIFIAGHGVLDEELDYYFASYDMDFQKPQEKGIAYSELEALLDGIKPLKKTLLIDACHSGEIDKEEVELIANNTKQEGDIQFRTVGKAAAPKLGMQSTSELSKSLFTDLRKGTGATVISSAGGMEFAMEGADWNNGLFTYCLLNGVRYMEADLNGDKEIWLSELQQYIQQKVFELSKGQQKPTSRIENQTVDFRLF